MANCRFGKHPPKVDYRTLRFQSYLKAGIVAPPASYNVLDTVYRNLKSSDSAKLFPMDGNDTIGDCTIAALAHAITVYRGLLKTKKIMAQAAVQKLYYHLTGGPDTGVNELDVLNYWGVKPVGADGSLAFVKIEPKKTTPTQQTIQKFGGDYLGVQG